MSDFTWYSRLLIWVGAMVLLIEAVFGRSTGFLTALAVIALAAGLLGFVGGLAYEGIAFRLFIPVMETAPATAATPAGEPDARESFAESEPPIGTRPVPEAAETMQVPPETDAKTAIASAQSPPGALSVEVEPASILVGIPCMACHEPVRAGQVAATCGECGGVHHATCWVGNHFHCARGGCSGHGNLRAPQ